MLVSRSSRTVRAGLFGLALAVLVLMVPVEVSAQSFIERLQNTVEIMIGLGTKEHVLGSMDVRFNTKPNCIRKSGRFSQTWFGTPNAILNTSSISLIRP